MLAQVLDRGIHSARQLVARLRRDHRFTRIRELGQAGGEVDAVAEHVECLDDDFRDVDAGAHAERGRIALGVEARQVGMQLEGAPQCLRGVRKLGDEAVGRNLEHAAPGVRRNDLRRGMGEECAATLDGALLVVLHERNGVAHLGHQDGAALPRRRDAVEGTRLLHRRTGSGLGLRLYVAREPRQRGDVEQHQPAAGALEQSLAHQARQLARDLLARGAHPARDIVVRRRRIEPRAILVDAGEAREAQQLDPGAALHWLGAELEQAAGELAHRAGQAAQQTLAYRGVVGKDGAERLGRHRGEQRFAQRQRVGEARAAVDRRMLTKHLARGELAKDDAPAATGFAR